MRPTGSISRWSSQYGRYLAGVAQGDLGPSFRYKDFRVTELIAQRPAAEPNYRPRGRGAGIPHRRAARRAARRGAPIRCCDHALMSFSMLGVVLPGFVVGPLLALVFGIYWPIFRVGGYEPGRCEFPGAAGDHAGAARGRLRRAPHAQQHAGSAARQLHPHRARQGTAHARGVPAARAAARAHSRGQLSRAGDRVRDHRFAGGRVGVRPAGLRAAILVQGAIDRDYPLVMGMILVYGVVTLVCNLIADLLYGWLDPRVRLA